MINESTIVEIYKEVLATKHMSHKYNKLRKKCIKHRSKFESNLTEEQREQLENLIEERTVMDELELREFFIEGFRQGVKKLSEMLCNKK